MINNHILNRPRLLGALAALLGHGAAAADRAAPAQAPLAARPELVVCADPTNLPYADDHTPGFENRIAELLAADFHASLRYDWYRPYRSFLKNTLLAGACDTIISVPAVLPGVAVTKPYFTSSFVAVTRAADSRHFTSFDDAWLKDARIGVQLIGTDDSMIPPTEALARRGVTQHITGFAMRSATPVENPQGRIIDAVAGGKIDVAFVWGPIAGYFAKPHGSALRIDMIANDPANPDLVFTYPIAMAACASNTELRDHLQSAIDRHGPEIMAILREFGVPLVPQRQASTQLPVTTIAQKAGSPP